MNETDELFTRIITARDRFVQIAAERLLNQSLYNMRDITPSKIPDQAGVYIF
ncbi:MAG: hypothetical protein RBG13Loki_0044 [Promethearchaeota archaeon CR_4]|nr:MAG: hypothetical protein RBG13Loki_0044 [Candidatus Lokiarchaeota archaeon CR_4]